MRYTYSSKDKLKSKKTIERLFQEGDSVSVYPLRLVFLETSFDDVQIKTAISVSKKHFKTAVQRNRIKRLMREAYRLNKHVFFNNFTTQYAFMILYIGKTEPTLPFLESKMSALFERFREKIAS